nr:MAG TPA: hypothetical protein [Bacteriophage sp.]
MWNKLLCGVGGDSPQQFNHGVLLCFNGLQMGNCSGLVRLDLCQFVNEILEEIRQCLKQCSQLVIDILHKFTPLSEHPANKELQPCRGCAFRIKRCGRFRKDIRNVVIVCLQINIQVSKRPCTERTRVICGGERESLPCCFHQRGAGQRLLRCQILHRVHQLPRRTEHKPDNAPCNIFPKFNLRDTRHITPPLQYRPKRSPPGCSGCSRRPRPERWH